MEIRINDEAVLTTEHSASSYGIPILVIGAEAYGARDLLPAINDDDPLAWLNEGRDKSPGCWWAQNTVRHWVEDTSPTGEALEMAQAFIKSGEAG